MHRRRFLAALAAAPLVSLTRRAGAQAATKLKSIDHGARGTTFWLSLENAPFPAPGAGYRDDTVAVFVPSHYRYDYDDDEEGVAALVHFHGHSTTAERAMTAHELREQLADSRQNAILIVPQLAVMAADSSCGKLESSGGLARLVSEAIVTTAHEGHSTLGDARFPVHARRGTVCVSAHSGGYHAAACCLRTGGLDVRETYLFDSLYAEVETFRDWVTSRKGASLHRRHKLVNFFVDGTRTDANSSALRAQLDRAGVLTASELQEGELSRHELSHAQAVFLRTSLYHSNVTWETNALRDCLYASALERHLSSTWFSRKNEARPIRSAAVVGNPLQDEDTPIVRRHVDRVNFAWGRHVEGPRSRPNVGVEPLRPCTGLRERKTDRIPLLGEVEHDHRVLFGVRAIGRSMAMVRDQRSPLERLLKVIERLAAAERPGGASQLAGASIHADEWTSEVIVEVLPVHIAAKVDARRSFAGKSVVVADLLTLPEHRDALRRQEGDRKGLLAPRAAPIAGRERAGPSRACKHDEMRMIVRVQVLQRRYRHVDRLARRVDHGLRRGVPACEGWVERVRESIGGRSAGHRPCESGARGPRTRRRPERPASRRRSGSRTPPAAKEGKAPTSFGANTMVVSASCRLSEGSSRSGASTRCPSRGVNGRRAYGASCGHAVPQLAGPSRLEPPFTSPRSAVFRERIVVSRKGRSASTRGLLEKSKRRSHESKERLVIQRRCAVIEERVIVFEERVIVFEERVIVFEERVIVFEERVIVFEERVIVFEERVIVFEERDFSSEKGRSANKDR